MEFFTDIAHQNLAFQISRDSVQLHAVFFAPQILKLRMSPFPITREMYSLEKSDPIQLEQIKIQML